MKAFISKFILFSFFILTAITFPPSSFAQTNANPKPVTVILSQNQTINHDYFAAGNNVIISGIINGDAYVAGGNVDIEGTINGDLLVAGGQVNIRGDVKQNVRALGGNVHVAGKVGRNITALGGTVDLASTASVAGSLVSVGGNVSLFGPVGKNVNIIGGNIELANTISGNADIRAGSLVLSSKAKINKNLSYTSPEKAQMSSGAVVSGKIIYAPTPTQKTSQPQTIQDIWKVLVGMYIAFKLIGFAASLVMGLLLIRFLPVYTSRTADVIQKDFWRSLGVGFVTLILAPFIIILLFVTLIGVPLAFLTIATVIIVIYLAHIFAAIVIGRWVGQLLKKEYGSYVAFVLGLIIYTILSLISPVNIIVTVIVAFVGVGAVIVEETAFYRVLRSKNLI